MKKRIYSVGIVLIAALLTACQAVPDKQSIVNKNGGRFEATLEMTRKPDETLQGQIQLAEDFTSTDGSVKFHMVIDQSLSTEKMPVVEVVPHKLTSADTQRVAEALLGDVEFYEREPSVNPKFSKSQYQQMLNRLIPYSNMEAMTELAGPSAGETLELTKDLITYITQAMETAPEEDPHSLCDWTLKKERFYNNGSLDIGGRPLHEDDDWLVATATKEQMGYTYMVIVRDQKDYKLNRFSIQLGGATVEPSLDRKIYWSKLCRTGKPTPEQISRVEDQVMGIMEEMDLGQWKIARTEIEIYSSASEPEYMVRVDLVPVLNGIPAIYGQGNPDLSEDYTGAYVLTQASFLMSANGDVIDMELDSPIEVKSIINENVATLPFNQLMERAQQHLSLSDAGNYGMSDAMIKMLEKEYQEEISCIVDISQIEYGLSRVSVKNTTESYYYVPVLVFRGNIQYQGMSTGTIYFDFADYGVDLDTLLWVNAVDGSIIG